MTPGPEPRSKLAPGRAPLRSRRALADELSDSIARDYIHSGLVPPDELLPSEQELAEQYGVSRVTTRASLRSLREAGLITVRHGVGSIVLPRSAALMYGLDRLASLETLADEAGGTISTEDADIAEIAADEELADQLKVDVGHPVLRIQRAKAYEGKRVAWVVDFVPGGALAFDVVRAEFDGSVLDVLLAHEELAVDYADCEIRAVLLPDEIAATMHVDPGTVGLFMEEFVYTADGRIVDRGISWHLQEYRGFFLRRRRQIGL